MTDLGRAEALRRAVRVSAMIVLPFGLFWASIGLAIGAPSLTWQGVIGASLALWLLIEVRNTTQRSEGTIATRIAIGAQVAALGTVLAEPVIGVAIALSSLIPILLALPYVGRQSLTRIMAVSAGAGRSHSPRRLPCRGELAIRR